MNYDAQSYRKYFTLLAGRKYTALKLGTRWLTELEAEHDQSQLAIAHRVLLLAQQKLQFLVDDATISTLSLSERDQCETCAGLFNALNDRLTAVSTAMGVI